MNDYLLLAIRTIFGYIMLFILMKVMGKREIGQLSLFDLIILLSIADIMVYGLDNFKSNILFSFLPMIIVALLQKLIAYLSLKLYFIRKLIDGKESYIIIHGKLNVKEMVKNRYNMDDLYTQLREQNLKAIEEVEYAILEANGKLSVFKHQTNKTYSLPLIISGRLINDNIKYEGLNVNFILDELLRQNILLKDCLGASLCEGKLKICERI